VLAERDASSGMWAFGDAVRAAYLFVLLYALWPAGYNTVAWLIRRSLAAIVVVAAFAVLCHGSGGGFERIAIAAALRDDAG